MALYPRALEALMEALARLPGVGRKTAERLALHLVRAPAAEVRALSQALDGLREQVRTCSLCHNLADRDPCPICADPKREAGLLAVVETPADLSALEATGAFGGRYYVLAGALAPLEGVGPRQLHLEELVARVQKDKIREVVIATNPTVEGEATADLIRRALAPCKVSVTRLGYGMPVGGDLKYMDQLTLSRSLASRQRLED